MLENSRLYSIFGLILEYRVTPFSGYFIRESPNPQGIIGDEYGLATISDLKFSENEEHISFTKEYVGRNSQIVYTLKKEGNLWRGRYQGHLELCGGIVAKIDSADFPSDLIMDVLQEERNPKRLAESFLTNMISDGTLIPKGNGYELNLSAEEIERRARQYEEKNLDEDRDSSNSDDLPF